MGPPMQVLAAFGVAGSVPVALDGGQGTSWRAGDLVLKPSDADLAELAWRAGIHRELVCDGFRLAMPRAAADGSLRVDGWCASEHLAGAQAPPPGATDGMGDTASSGTTTLPRTWRQSSCTRAEPDGLRRRSSSTSSRPPTRRSTIDCGRLRPRSQAPTARQVHRGLLAYAQALIVSGFQAWSQAWQLVPAGAVPSLDEVAVDAYADRPGVAGIHGCD